MARPLSDYALNQVSRGVCLLVGTMLSLSLAHGLKPAVEWLKENKPAHVRVAVRAAAPAVTSAPAKPPQAQPTPAVLPLHTEASKSVPKPKVPVQPDLAVSAAAAPPAPVTPPEVLPLPTLTQPALTPPQVATPPTLPQIQGSPVPPAPAEEVVHLENYPEEPGGPVLVLQLTVNDGGVVVDSRILVPSFNQLGDLSIALAARGQRWTNLVPPLAPGEMRKLEIRIPYATDGGTPTSAVIP